MSSLRWPACSRTRAEQRPAVVADAVDRVALSLDRDAGAGDLVATLVDVVGDRLLPSLERVEPSRLRRGLSLGVADGGDDLAVLLADPLQVRAVLQQLREAVGVEHDADHVGLVGLVDLDEAGGQRSARAGQPRSQSRQAGAHVAQVLLGGRQLAALGVELDLDLVLSALERVDAALERVDSPRQRADVTGEHARSAARLVELTLLLVDAALQAVDVVLRVGAGDDRQRNPDGKGQQESDEQEAEAHAAGESRFGRRRGQARSHSYGTEWRPALPWFAGVSTQVSVATAYARCDIGPELAEIPRSPFGIVHARV